MKSAVVRKKFLEYFVKKGHQLVPTSSVVPNNDPTLLFTNAGMVQFKETFLGQEPRSYVRATSSQRCIRAGGKHNDLENVGYTARHHTFFEMLGNFSFGDYFKREAIQFSWKFLTEELAIPKEKLWITVYEEDDEAADIWIKEMGVPADRLSRCGEKDNFWSMGDTGPCGPCSEIFYDHGAEIWGGPPGTPEEDGDRYIEIWNLVFMQFNRTVDGALTPLPKPSVDTGMGLERLAAVLQGVHDNYETDSFVPLLEEIGKLANITDIQQTSARVVADHIRSASFLITDGVIPLNEGRGYVLRRIIRRAIRHGNKLGLHDAFLYKLVPMLVEQMGEAYPELVQAQAQIIHFLQEEEQQFAKTLEQGLRIFKNEITNLKDKMIPGEIIFKLYDTYGFPMDLTGDIARERGLELDVKGFEIAMSRQRQQSQAASQFSVDYNNNLQIKDTTEFSGYEELVTEAIITTIIKDNTVVTQLNEGDSGIVILDRTPFYTESGGQVGDTGSLGNEQANFVVENAQKLNSVHLHHGKVIIGMLNVGDKLSAEVDSERREAIKLNHSATHLLHAALQQILGQHVQQKGSLVEAERLRFDFTHANALSATEIQQVEFMVNEKIRENIIAKTKIMSPDEAKKTGAMALFGEKYGDKVRVLNFADFSKELCGGTHVSRTGDIGLFKISEETSIASGIRRIEAVTGNYALDYVEDANVQIQNLARQLKTPRATVQGKVLQLTTRVRELEKEIAELKTKLSSVAGNDLVHQAEEIKGVKILFAELPDADAKALGTIADQLKNKLVKAVVVLATTQGANVSLVAGVTKNLTASVKAGELVNEVASRIGGKGGGRPDMARAGGNQPENLAAAFTAAQTWLTKKLG